MNSVGLNNRTNDAGCAIGDKHGRSAKRLIKCLITAVAGMLFLSQTAHAYDTYATGHINNVTFVADEVFIRLDTAVPNNCSSSTYGWMKIPAQQKAMQSFVIGLWLRGDLAQVGVTVYTNATDGSGYCSVNQIDPVE